MSEVTVGAQVTAERLEERGAQRGWSLCLSSACEVVYFSELERVTLEETLATPAYKSESPVRLVCFCFQHSAAALERDGARLQAQITEACRAGLGDCERANPQGRCCLGYISQLLRSSAACTTTPCACPQESS